MRTREDAHEWITTFLEELDIEHRTMFRMVLTEFLTYLISDEVTNVDKD